MDKDGGGSYSSLDAPCAEHIAIFALSADAHLWLDFGMDEFTLFDDPLQFNPEYTWPKDGTEKDCPKCKGALTLNEQRPDYKGKPWWCSACRWQFTNEEV
jgi:hypothetical protein